MSYRSDRPPPPCCPICKQPAAAFDVFWAYWICPDRHAFDAPLDHVGCELPGLEPLPPDPPRRPWWRRLFGLPC